MTIFRERDRDFPSTRSKSSRGYNRIHNSLSLFFFYYQVYNAVGKPLVDAVFSGFNGTLMAYGQTGTGELSMTHVWLFGKSTCAYFYIHVFGHIASCPVN